MFAVAVRLYATLVGAHVCRTCTDKPPIRPHQQGTTSGFGTLAIPPHLYLIILGDPEFPSVAVRSPSSSERIGSIVIIYLSSNACAPLSNRLRLAIIILLSVVTTISLQWLP